MRCTRPSGAAPVRTEFIITGVGRTTGFFCGMNATSVIELGALRARMLEYGSIDSLPIRSLRLHLASATTRPGSTSSLPSSWPLPSFCSIERHPLVEKLPILQIITRQRSRITRIRPMTAEVVANILVFGKKVDLVTPPVGRSIYFVKHHTRPVFLYRIFDPKSPPPVAPVEANVLRPSEEINFVRANRHGCVDPIQVHIGPFFTHAPRIAVIDSTRINVNPQTLPPIE